MDLISNQWVVSVGSAVIAGVVLSFLPKSWFADKKKTVAVLNRGTNNRFLNNSFVGFDVGLQDEGENTVAKGNQFFAPLQRLVSRNIDWNKMGAICALAALVWAVAFSLWEVSSREPHKLYASTQIAYQNGPETELSSIDIDGRGMLVPMYSETIEAAVDFGEKFGEKGKMYMHRVVVMALDPSIRYTDLPSGKSFATAYDPDKLYTFLLPDGKDVKEEWVREHTISVNGGIYKVVLLAIDGRNNTFSYRFRIEELRP